MESFWVKLDHFTEKRRYPRLFWSLCDYVLIFETFKHYFCAGVRQIKSNWKEMPRITLDYSIEKFLFASDQATGTRN